MRPGWRGWVVNAARLAWVCTTGLIALTLLIMLFIGVIFLPLAGLGIPVLIGGVVSTRRLADVRRLEVRRVLRSEPIEVVYQSRPGWRLRTEVVPCLRDPQTWRDLAWLFVHAATGFGLAVLGFGVGAVLITLVGSAFAAFLPLLPVLLLVWWTIPWLVWLFARLDGVLLAPATPPDLVRRVEQLTESRAATVDEQAAELRRIERDLHDGPQVRLAAMGMTLGLAAQQVRRDPEQTAALLEEARRDVGRALVELRDLVRGIHPPVLADRGLAGGLEALALLCPLPVEVAVELAARPKAQVESAAYFAAAEGLANVAKHSGASRAWLRVQQRNGILRLVVGDDGRGGADPESGTGLRGIERRLAAFDGTLRVHSPAGGPTELTMELPCESSSPRTTSSSGTA